MCERYAVPDQAAAERELEPEHAWWKFCASFNVAPARWVPAVRLYEGRSEAVMMRWGVVPPGAQGTASTRHCLRVSAEALERSDFFRGAWLAGQRCLLPFAGFYTWQLTPAGYRQPHFVQAAGRAVFAVAALWDRSESDDGDVIEGCALLEVPASPRVARIQTGTREMPAILRREDYARWLRGTPVEARELLRTPPDALLASHPVSPRINSLHCDDATLVQAVA